MQDVKQSHFPRRQLLAGVAALILAPALTLGQAAIAGGDGSSTKSTSSYKPRKPPFIKDKYTQREFLSLSPSEYDQISIQNEKSTDGKKIIIEGFSQPMTGYLMEMVGLERQAAKRLIRDMQKIKGNKARQARLRQEIDRMKRRIAKLREARERALKKGFKRAAGEARSRILYAEGYIESLEVWHRFPHEGAR